MGDPITSTNATGRPKRTGRECEETGHEETRASRFTAPPQAWNRDLDRGTGVPTDQGNCAPIRRGNNAGMLDVNRRSGSWPGALRDRAEIYAGIRLVLQYFAGGVVRSIDGSGRPNSPVGPPPAFAIRGAYGDFAQASPSARPSSSWSPTLATLEGKTGDSGRFAQTNSPDSRKYWWSGSFQWRVVGAAG